MTSSKRARTPTRRIRIRWIRVAVLLVVAAIAAAVVYQSLASSPSRPAAPGDALRSDDRRALGKALPSTVWPASGQAAVQIGQSQIQAGPNQHPAPIASVAKVMTAYVVLRDHPLQPGEDGPTITLTAADIADTERRRRQQESVVPVAAGEQLTELQALQALLLPSANNIAAVLARWDAGSVDRFVARMNALARSLGMTHTRYTDPSGFDDATVSTAADQVRLVVRAMRLPVFASIVAMPSATLPVAGTVHNTNTLLGRNGFVGVKTGSTAAAGGCFAFRAIRWIDGKQTTITGVVLGQPGHNRIAAGLAAADAIVGRIAGRSPRQVPPLPDLRQRTLAPRSAPRGHRRQLNATQSRHARRNVRRTPRPLSVLAMLAALIVAGCASTSGGSGSGSSNSIAAARDKAVQFAECMRANGVSAFPDPDASGELTVDAVANRSSVDTSSAAFEQAISACKDLEPPGFTGHERTPEQQTVALRFAQCIRDNGVPDFPDPTPDAPLVDTNRIPSAARPGGMSILNAAMQKCRGFAAAAGATGGR